MRFRFPKVERPHVMKLRDDERDHARETDAKRLCEHRGVRFIRSVTICWRKHDEERGEKRGEDDRNHADGDELACKAWTEDFLDDIGDEEGDRIHKDRDGCGDPENCDDFCTEKVHPDKHRHKHTEKKVDFVFLSEVEFHSWEENGKCPAIGGIPQKAGENGEE